MSPARRRRSWRTLCLALPGSRPICPLPCRLADRVTADRAYDHRPQRHELRKRGICAEVARCETEHGSGIGRYRWGVERTVARLHHFKRLLVRYDRRAYIHEAFLAIACCLVCYRRLRNAAL
jgi:transposase